MKLFSYPHVGRLCLPRASKPAGQAREILIIINIIKILIMGHIVSQALIEKKIWASDLVRATSMKSLKTLEHRNLPIWGK